jgi:Spy/CpxP family protein refolding chaperone
LRLSMIKTLTGKSLFTVSCGFAFALLAFCVPAARAQDPAPQQREEEMPPPQTTPAPNEAVGLLMQLNLSPEQVGQMREIQRQSAPEARALNRRLNIARRALDEAIYADSLDEALIGQRAREVSEAQTALVALRARTELRVRRVLTPAQLQTFRGLRQEARRNQRMQRRLNNGNNPQRPRRNAIDSQNRPNPNAPADQKPNARPLNLRERRRGGLRRP